MIVCSSGNRIFVFNSHYNRRILQDNDEDLIYSIEPLDYNRFFTAGLNGKINLWRYDRICETYIGHTACVCSLKILDSKLYSFGDENCLKIWDIETTICDTIEEESCVQNTLKAIDNNLLIYNLFNSKEICLYDTRYRKVVRRFNTTGGILWSNLILGSNSFCSGCDDGVVSSFDLRTIRPYYEARIDMPINCITKNSNEYFIGTSNGQILVSNILEIDLMEPLFHNDDVVCIDIDGDILFSSSNDNSLNIFDITLNKNLFEEQNDSVTFAFAKI